MTPAMSVEQLILQYGDRFTVIDSNGHRWAGYVFTRSKGGDPYIELVRDERRSSVRDRREVTE